MSGLIKMERHHSDNSDNNDDWGPSQLGRTSAVRLEDNSFDVTDNCVEDDDGCASFENREREEKKLLKVKIEALKKVQENAVAVCSISASGGPKDKVKTLSNFEIVKKEAIKREKKAANENLKIVKKEVIKREKKAANETLKIVKKEVVERKKKTALVFYSSTDDESLGSAEEQVSDLQESSDIMEVKMQPGLAKTVIELNSSLGESSDESLTEEEVAEDDKMIGHQSSILDVEEVESFENAGGNDSTVVIMETDEELEESVRNELCSLALVEESRSENNSEGDYRNVSGRVTSVCNGSTPTLTKNRRREALRILPDPNMSANKPIGKIGATLNVKVQSFNRGYPSDISTDQIESQETGSSSSSLSHLSSSIEEITSDGESQKENVIPGDEERVIAGMHGTASVRSTIKQDKMLSTQPPVSSLAPVLNKDGGEDSESSDSIDEDFLSANEHLDSGDDNGDSDIQVLNHKPKSKAEPLGAAALNYYNEEETQSSDSNDDALSNYGESSEESDIQILDKEPKSKAGRRDVYDIVALTEDFKKLPLGRKATKQPTINYLPAKPKRSERKEEPYNPRNETHKKLYGDVNRTVEMLAQTIETMPTQDNFPEDDLPARKIKLYPHQKYGLQWLLWREQEFPGGGILADEMGLGKTLMITALILKSKIKLDNDKNRISIEMNQELTPSTATLIICPLGCLNQWEEEIKKMDSELQVYTYYDKKRTTSARTLAKHDIVLSTYSTVQHDIPCEDKSKKSFKSTAKSSPLLQVAWRRIVLDEAHEIRNPKTKKALSICQINARHRWAVTGTPVHNRPEDLFSIVKFLRMKPFDVPKVWNYWIGLKRIKKGEQAQYRLQTIGKALILRRTKLEVEAMSGKVAAIPPKTVETVVVELSTEERRVYDHLMKFAQQMFHDFLKDKEERQLKKERERERELRKAAYSGARKKEPKQNATKKKPKQDPSQDQDVKDVRLIHMLVLVTRLRQCAVHPRLIKTMLEDESIPDDASFNELLHDHVISQRNPVFKQKYRSAKIRRILQDLEDLRTEARSKNKKVTDKVVIISSWTATLDILHRHLQKREFSCVFITGRDSMEERYEAQRKFNTPGEPPEIVLLSLNAGGVGLNLTGGNYVFFIEPYWNPQMELQAQDRVHRFGQTKEVVIKRYVTKDTIEERVVELQQQKRDLADGVLSNTKKGSGSGLTIGQISHLFAI